MTYTDAFKDNAIEWMGLTNDMYRNLKGWARKSMEEALKAGIPNLSYDVEKLLNSWVTTCLAPIFRANLAVAPAKSSSNKMVSSAPASLLCW